MSNKNKHGGNLLVTAVSYVLKKGAVIKPSEIHFKKMNSAVFFLFFYSVKDSQ